ncbi:MAG: hemerythrin family protein [Deltaproteobacteria bacterium]|nr:hemerythrin family protein [Deltaproteobacteria bacterium]
MAIQWTEALATGAADIDNQHKELFKRINSLFDACQQGKGKSEVMNVLKFLEDYIETHFSAEENLQRGHSYPDYPAHKAMHEQFRKEFYEFKKGLEKEGTTLSTVIQTNRLLSSWWTEHIGKVDKALGAFLKSRL